MSLASNRVFTNKELLGHVLIQLIDKEAPFTTIHNVRQLVALKRVNRAFAALCNSDELRWHMGSGCLPRPARGIRTPISHIAVTALRSGEISLPPFRLCTRASLQFTNTSTSPKTLWLLFQVSADDFAEEYLGTLGYSVSLRVGDGKIYAGREQSWHELRLATREIPIAIAVAVFRPRTNMAKNLTSGPFYHEWIRFKAGEGTLGDVADFFEQIGRKRRREHEKGIIRYEGELWSDVHPPPEPFSKCSSLLLKILWECCRCWLLYAVMKWCVVQIWMFLQAHFALFTVSFCVVGLLDMVRGQYAAYQAKRRIGAVEKVDVYN